ncbi:MAG: MATE family efflux transporter [Rhodobacteraceae bacterium]|nr:MATE family efflux transporter [Paracoccaceae bacterium]
MKSHARTYPEHVRAVLVLGLPLIGGHLAQFSIGLTDTVMLGWYGVDELAALTLANSWFFVLFLMGGGFAWAVMPMVAQFHARGDQVQCRRATRMGLWLSLAYSAAVLPFLLWAKIPLLALGQKPELAEAAQVYLRIAGWGVVPSLSVLVLKSYLAALERTQIVLWITVGAAIMNALLNYALIFGNWGAPELGIRGAAWASLLTNSLSLVGCIAYIQITLPQERLFQRFWRIDAEMMRRVFQLGWPIGLTNLSEVGLFASSAILMGWLGTIPLAAHGIALQLTSATFMVHLGLSNVATIRSGNALGRRDAENLARGGIAVTGLSVAVSLITIGVFLSIPEALIGLFVDSNEPALPQILAIGAGLLAMAALFQLVDGAQAIALGLLRGLQDTRLPMIMAAIAYWLVGLPACLLFGFAFDWGGIGVWMGLVLGLSVAAVLLTLRFWRQKLPQQKRV